MKQILLEILSELEYLRANQAVLARLAGTGVSMADAQDAKNTAMQESRRALADLRKKIEALK